MKKYGIVLLLAACMSFTGCADPVAEGTELLEEGRYEEAAEQFEEAVEKEKQLGEAYLGLGICSYETSDYEQAKSMLEQARDHGAQASGKLYNMMGQCEMQLGDFENAAYYFENGQTFSDVSDEVKQEMAFNEISMYEKIGEYAKAKEKLEIYVNNYPADEVAAKELEFLTTQVKEAE